MLNILESIQEHQEIIQELPKFIPLIEQMANKMSRSIAQGGTIFWLGNGGSAADAQHLAAELVGRFKRERQAIASMSLSTDTSILTCLSNDYDYSVIFARQLEAYCRPGDVVVGLSTSGKSVNLIKAMEVAKQKGAYCIALLGKDGGDLLEKVDCALVVPSFSTARIQEAHTLIGHMLCEWIENTVETHS